MSNAKILTFLGALGLAATCCLAVAHFLFVVAGNGLGWSPVIDARFHYLAVGRYYSQGFAVGFFFGFALCVAAVVIARWREARFAQRR